MCVYFFISNKQYDVCVCVKAPRNTVLMVFNQFQSRGWYTCIWQRISFHPLPNEDGGLGLWYLRGTPWRRTCKFEPFELLTSCCNTVFCNFRFRFRYMSDDVSDFNPSLFDESRSISFEFWTSLWRTYELRSPPWRSTTLGPCSK